MVKWCTWPHGPAPSDLALLAPLHEVLSPINNGILVPLERTKGWWNQWGPLAPLVVPIVLAAFSHLQSVERPLPK
jgi:hypothetical protein